MMDTKILCNSVISDAHKGARFFNADIRDFFLMSWMPEPEYMQLRTSIFHLISAKNIIWITKLLTMVTFI